MNAKRTDAVPAASSPCSASSCRLMRGPLGWIAGLLALLGVGVPLAWHTALLGVAGASSTSHGFKYRSYGEMVAYLKQLNETYPELVRVAVAQEQYSLPYPEELTCVEDDATGATVPCKQFIVHLTNHSSMPDVDRPEVFVSGALHGNERVGPITAIELIALMAKSATAYAASSSDSEVDTEKDAERLGIQNTRRWLYELLQTRSIYIMPMTNAYGYAHDRREELDVDPNRDYNYMRHPQECMQAMTSRAVNEIWREHLFQLAITFHGGMRAISYEWGSPDHYLAGHARTSEKSPDHMAQFQLANVFAAYAGAFQDGTLYPTGTMNDVVYGVTGGMEDWAYAASWENDFVKKDKPFQPCQPTTFGGYDAVKTVYNNLTHRAFNMLVETSDSKRPEEDALGFFEDLYNSDLDYYELDKQFMAGHVTQNVRLALMMIDMVEPYIRWVHMSPPKQATALMAQPGVFPSAAWYVNDTKQLKQLGCGSTKSTKTITVVSCNMRKCHIDASTDSHVKLQLAWEVLGAFRVDQTHVQVSSSIYFKRKDILLETTTQAGLTRRYFDFGSPEENEDTLGSSLFTACVDWNRSLPHKVYVRAVATVDQDWATQGVGNDVPSPRIPPQSHLVNARTNADWDETWNGHRVRGRLQWHSPVISVKATTESSAIASLSGDGTTSTTPTQSTATEKVNDTSASDAGDIDGSSAASDSQRPNVPTIVSVAPSASPADSVTEDSNVGADLTSTDDETEGLEDSSESGAEGTDISGDDKVEEVEEEMEEDEEESNTTATPTPKTHPPKISVISNIGSEVTSTKTTDSAVVKDPSSLLNMGYVVLASGGMVISVTLLYLYRRVFRAKRQASYVSVNNQARGGRDDDEDDDEEEEDEDADDV